MKWAIALGLWALWMLWEIRHAPDAKDALPHSRRCSWCGQHMSELDKWLEDNGATVSHTICPTCALTLEDE